MSLEAKAHDVAVKQFKEYLAWRRLEELLGHRMRSMIVRHLFGFIGVGGSLSLSWSLLVESNEIKFVDN